jgi:tripartite-type tricarboxylate transporter receptor subunit TctC
MAFRLRHISIAVAAACAATAAGAQSPETFYAGRQVPLVISFAPGGLNDLAGRATARHLGRFIPGNPVIVPQNMPGAGGLAAANYLFNVAAHDGSVIGQLDRSVAQNAIRGASTARFDPLKFTWIGSLSSYGNDAYLLLVRANHEARNAGDLTSGNIKTRLGAVSGGSNMFISLIAKSVLGLKVDVITGYPGGKGIWIALQNGELDGQAMSLSSVKAEQPAMWRDKQVRPLVQFGRETRLAELADVPTARELAGNDPEKRALIDFAELPFRASLPYVAPPGLPEDRAGALRRAFMAMARDPAFIEEASKLSIELSPISGEDIVALLQRSSSIPPDLIARYNAIVEPKN